MSDNICATCRFWRGYDGSHIGEEALEKVPAVINGKSVDTVEFGQCRRNPPVISDHMAGIAIQRIGFGGHVFDPEQIADSTSVHRSCLWPVTYFTEWCGEHPDIAEQWSSPC